MSCIFLQIIQEMWGLCCGRYDPSIIIDMKLHKDGIVSTARGTFQFVVQHVYIHIDRERERERERDIVMQKTNCMILIGIGKIYLSTNCNNNMDKERTHTTIPCTVTVSKFEGARAVHTSQATTQGGAPSALRRWSTRVWAKAVDRSAGCTLLTTCCVVAGGCETSTGGGGAGAEY
jgi:hypothetical protein